VVTANLNHIYKVVDEIPEQKRKLGVAGVEGRIILKWILSKQAQGIQLSQARVQ
jgi:hypothetical protein